VERIEFLGQRLAKSGGFLLGRTGSDISPKCQGDWGGQALKKRGQLSPRSSVKWIFAHSAIVARFAKPVSGK
jgi:hypothetical protein